ncbi:DUF4214 domain-containing protein [Stutzerimonas xanthomarina]|uniref:DUF4214 domain-containing protein n=1 Tax=Stutzerimonas xanthomarina TaxID=271420 RepID=UPI003AA9B432
MATSAQVQQLYIALLGRAADKPGLDWWLENINGGERTLEQAAAAFTTSEEFVSTYGSLQGAELVTAVYTNLFERTPSQEEVAYWVADGRPADELLSAFLTYASPADQTVINNKVTVAQYYTEAAGSEIDLDAAAAIIANVNGTAVSVSTALQNLPVSDATLTAALAEWEAAVEARETFLASLDLDNDGETSDTLASDVTALVDAIGTGPVGDFNALVGSTVLTASSSVAAQNAAFAAARAELQVDISNQEAVVTDAQAAVTALGDSLDVNRYIAALEAENNTKGAVTAANAAAAGAIASYNTLNTVDVADSEYVVSAGTTTLSGNLASVAQVQDGVIVAKPGFTEATNPGITSLLSAVNADVAAEIADDEAEAALTTAEGRVGDGTATSAGYGAVDTLISAQEALEQLEAVTAVELEALIADVQEAYSLNAQLTALNTAAGNAFADIDGAELVDAPLEGGTLGADLFIFVEGTDSDVSLGATDRLFFGSEYSLVDLEGADPLTANVGDVNALEVFWEVDTLAGNTVLYVENEAFSGNATGDNFTTITLTGVTAELELTSGFVQLA